MENNTLLEGDIVAVNNTTGLIRKISNQTGCECTIQCIAKDLSYFTVCCSYQKVTLLLSQM